MNLPWSETQFDIAAGGSRILPESACRNSQVGRWLDGRLARQLATVAKRQHVTPTRFLLTVSVRSQTVSLFRKVPCPCATAQFPRFQFWKRFRASTSAWGTGQQMNSNQTPLGLHRIARKIGAGHPIGTVFRSRVPLGLTWAGLPDASIVHRILWLEGLEPGHNRGGAVDTFARYIYIHGFGDELTLGRPCSHGCVHLAATDLLPLFDLLPAGTLVWIGES